MRRIWAVGILQVFLNLQEDRYVALEETRRMLGFTKSEWKSLLVALSKTDNGWLQFMRGELTIDIKKFVDIDELHMRFELKRKENVTRTASYIYELNEFTKPRSKKCI
jgi:hypothetical protein